MRIFVLKDFAILPMLDHILSIFWNLLDTLGLADLSCILMGAYN